jgi:uncharacterized Fe-S cluster protein YjdI
MSKPLQLYPTPDVLVTFDPNICLHMGVCLRGNPEVFDLSRPDWIHPDAASAEAVAELVARCPSGALQAIRPGVRPGTPLPSAGVSIAATRNGPIVVKGPVTLELPSGQREKRSGAFSLCRCGQTQRTPFCDGSHLTTGFRSPA